MGTFIVGSFVLAAIIGAVCQIYKDGNISCSCSGCGKCNKDN